MSRLFSRSSIGNVSIATAALAAACVLALSGCDGRPRRVPVSGTVLIDGKPLTSGFVYVIPDDARPAIGKIDGAGKFILTTFDENDGCVPGIHSVTIIANQQITPTRMKWLAPKKYMDIATTDQKITVEKPIDDLVIELTWAGGRPYVEDTGGAGDVDPNASLAPAPAEEK
jgi:hypothetical protein